MKVRLLSENKVSAVRIKDKYHVRVELKDGNYIHRYSFESLSDAVNLVSRILSVRHLDLQYWDKLDISDIHDKYLVRNHGKKRKAHLWNGVDTLCTMWSTGGFGSGIGYDLYSDNCEKDVCSMCINNLNKQHQKIR